MFIKGRRPKEEEYGEEEEEKTIDELTPLRRRQQQQPSARVFCVLANLYSILFSLLIIASRRWLEPHLGVCVLVCVPGFFSAQFYSKFLFKYFTVVHVFFFLARQKFQTFFATKVNSRNSPKVHFAIYLICVFVLKLIK